MEDYKITIRTYASNGFSVGTSFTVRVKHDLMQYHKTGFDRMMHNESACVNNYYITYNLIY